MKKTPTLIRVVALALVDGRSRVLMQRRPPEKAHGGLWEFPGGKVESGETDEVALRREIAEELAIELSDLESVADGAADDGVLQIVLYLCREWRGEPQALDASEIGWFALEAAEALDMPPLDRPLAAALRRLI